MAGRPLRRVDAVTAGGMRRMLEVPADGANSVGVSLPEEMEVESLRLTLPPSAEWPRVHKHHED
jgi:hypothetical protein